MTIRNLFDVHVPRAQKIRAVYDAGELESIAIGDIIAPYNDYYLRWDENCVPPSVLEGWRHEGDKLCDSVVRELRLGPGQDGLQAILDHIERPVAEQAACVQAFWAQISCEPPRDVTAFDLYKTATPAITSCHRRPAPTVAEGQAVFWRYSSQIFSALLHFSLAGGFSADRVVGVLRETNYLTGEDRDKTYRRLLETTQAITDYMASCSATRNGAYTRTTLHRVRVRLEGKRGVLNVYDNKQDGLPINQEDMLATLGSFAIAPLWSLKRQGIRLTPEEEMAHVAVWRHIGYYLGVDPDRLKRYYGSVEAASKMYACNTLHLFSFKAIPSDPTQTSTYRLLASASNRPPMNAPIGYTLALSRFLLGDGMANRLSVPPTGFRFQLRIRFAMTIEWALVYFGRIWTTRWEVERITMTRLLIRMIVCWQLGVKRTKFTPKVHFAEEEEKLVPGHDDDELDPSVRMGSEAGKAVVKRWKRLMVEMAVVLSVPLLAVFGVGAWSVR